MSGLGARQGWRLSGLGLACFDQMASLFPSHFMGKMAPLSFCLGRILMRALHCLLLTLSCALFPAPSNAEKLLPLHDADIPKVCGCSFGPESAPKSTLVFWALEDPRSGIVRDAKGLRALKLYSEKHLPEQRDPPRINDKLVVQIADGDWSVQMLGSVASVCAPKCKKCAGTTVGTTYRGKLVTLWAGRQRETIEAWGRCGCP